MSKHFPGPWHCKLDGTDFALFAKGGELIGVILRQLDEIHQIGKLRHGNSANGNLCAAAPDLLEALEDFLKIDDWQDESIAPAETVKKARAAIAKANGGAA